MRLALLAVLLLFATACVSSDFVNVGEETYAPRPDDWAIDVYLGTDAPVVAHKSIPNAKPAASIPRGASVIGRVDTSGAPLASWGKMINSAKDKARRLGGDALVVGGWGHHLASVDQYGNAYHGKNCSFTVIRYRK